MKARRLNAIEEPIGYATPYQFANVKIGTTYQSKLDVFEDPKTEVEHGLHSYAELVTIDYCLYPIAIIEKTHVIVECIIPAGARYYKGLHGINESYASDEFKYVRLIEADEYMKLANKSTVEVSTTHRIDTYEEYTEKYKTCV